MDGWMEEVKMREMLGNNDCNMNKKSKQMGHKQTYTHIHYSYSLNSGIKQASILYA